jgi:hypothetical protein
MKKSIAIIVLIVALAFTSLAGCRQADHVSYNVSKEADNFNVLRRLIVINNRTDTVLYELVGAFSLQGSRDTGEISVVVETGFDTYQKHYVGLSDETTYIVEDVSPKTEVNKYKYELTLYPESIVPITFETKDKDFFDIQRGEE